MGILRAHTGAIWCVEISELQTIIVLFWLIITTTKPPYSEPLKDLVNCTAT